MGILNIVGGREKEPEFMKGSAQTPQVGSVNAFLNNWNVEKGSKVIVFPGLVTGAGIGSYADRSQRDLHLFPGEILFVLQAGVHEEAHAVYRALEEGGEVYPEDATLLVTLPTRAGSMRGSSSSDVMRLIAGEGRVVGTLEETQSEKGFSYYKSSVLLPNGRVWDLAFFDIKEEELTRSAEDIKAGKRQAMRVMTIPVDAKFLDVIRSYQPGLPGTQATPAPVARKGYSTAAAQEPVGAGVNGDTDDSDIPF